MPDPEIHPTERNLMANLWMKICDVMASKGENVPATTTVKYTVPAAASPDRYSQSAQLDVCAKGEEEVQRMLAAADAATRKAWQPLLDLVPEAQRKAAATARAARQRKAAEATRQGPGEATDPVQAQPAGDDPEEDDPSVTLRSA